MVRALLAVSFLLANSQLWSQAVPAPASSAGKPAVQSHSSIYPVFVADLPNPNDFSLFANGGWDGNWYVGYNTCWVQKLTVPEGNYRKAFIGAKLGRMKNFLPSGKSPWEKKPYDGEIYMAISSTAVWTRAQSYFLTGTDDIPFEADFENALEGVGESQWYWKEVPMKLIHPGAAHYLALWSPTEKMNSISSSPILAAGWGSKDVDSWLSNDSKGVPPKDPNKALSTPVTVFEPAIAINLIPVCSTGTAGGHENCPESPTVRITKVENGKARGNQPAPKVLWSAVSGQSAQRAWLEISPNKKDWTKYGRSVWSAPYAFTVRMNEVLIGPEGKAWARVSAEDIFGNTGVSDAVNLFDNTLR